MSLQSQFKSKVLLVKIEPLTVIKNEPEIGMDQDIISADIKDEIDIEYHSLSEDLIKSEPIPNKLLESEHLESIETQTENPPFIKTKFENLVQTQDTNNGNLSIVSGSTHKKRKAKMDNCRLKYHCNKCKYKTLWKKNLDKHKVIHLKPNKIQYMCYHCTYKSNYKHTLRRHVFNHFKNGEVSFHCYICHFVTPNRNLIIEHFKKHTEHCSKWDETEYKNQVEAYTKKRKVKLSKIQYLCYHCTYKSNYKQTLKRHVFNHFKKGEVPFHCYICNFVTPKRNLIIEHFKKHPEHRSKWDETEYKNQVEAYTKKRKVKLSKIQYLCYHCPFKSKYKNSLKDHVFTHFKNGEIPFHCYICDFVTPKRDLIIEHFKKHPEHRSKWNKTEYKNQVEAYTKKKERYCCQKCGFYTCQDVKLKQHELSHEAERDDQHLKYHCDQCKYKTFRLGDLKVHKIVHRKPEEIQYFYCYHCSYKAKYKTNLKAHILLHFKTGKRKSITEYIKKHSKAQGKSKINKRSKRKKAILMH